MVAIELYEGVGTASRVRAGDVGRFVVLNHRAKMAGARLERCFGIGAWNIGL